jgi:hypothetical protein
VIAKLFCLLHVAQKRATWPVREFAALNIDWIMAVALRGVHMRISEQAKSQVIRLIDDGESLDPFDLEAFYSWMQASHEALGFDTIRQQRFDKYCCSSVDCTSMRLYVGVWMLKQALSNAVPENYPSMGAQG